MKVFINEEIQLREDSLCNTCGCPLRFHRWAEKEKPYGAECGHMGCGKFNPNRCLEFRPKQEDLCLWD